ncbi:MAG TPA: gas vesicle protein K [Oculatellaceae cyanobacterium]
MQRRANICRSSRYRRKSPSLRQIQEVVGGAGTDGNRQRVCLDPENVEKGLAQLVLTIIELLRQLMEKQAVHRMDSGELSDEQIDRMGETFIRLEEKVTELRQLFGLDPEDLNINLGPLGNLI